MAEETPEPRKNLPAEHRRIIASVENDITIPYFSDVLQPQDETLIQRGGSEGLKLYDDVERDTHAYAVLQKRKFGLVARNWIVEPASDEAPDQRAAELVEAELGRINFDQLCLDLLDATLKGYSVAEIVWKRDGAAIAVEKFKAHDPRRFTFDRQARLRLLTREAPMNGIELPDRKFVVHRFGEKGNNPFGLGLGSRLFWCVLFKREGVAFWLTFLEKFASPTPVGKHPEGMLPGQQAELLRTLRGMVQSGAVVVPIGTEVEFLEAQRSGNASYKEWCDYWDRQMSLCVFGSTLATYVEGQGSRAASETHKEAEEQIIDADGDLLSDTLAQSLARWLVEYNLPGARPPTVRRPRPKNETEHEDLRAKKAKNAKDELALLSDALGWVEPGKIVEAAEAFADAGLAPGIDRDVLTRLAPFLASRAENRRALSAATALTPAGQPARGNVTPPRPAFADPHDHGLAALADQLSIFADPMVATFVERFREELGRATTLEEARARLLAAHPDVTIDAFGNLLAAGLTLAELTGRADVQDEMDE